MIETAQHMFTGSEAAVAYALAAEHIFGQDGSLLKAHHSLVPIFVSHLFQSLEISIKVAGVESGLFSAQEARARQNRSGHGIKELATLAVEKLGGDPFVPIVMAMTHGNSAQRASQFLTMMICGPDMERTRQSYASRCLGYAEVAEGDFGLIYPVQEWIEAVKQTALNLRTTVDIMAQWKASPSQSKHFAIWVKDQLGETAPQ